MHLHLDDERDLGGVRRDPPPARRTNRARRPSLKTALPPPIALTEDEEADATRLRLVMARLLVGDMWRPETRGMLYELAAHAQQHYPADWEQRLAAAYGQTRDGLAPGDLPVPAADEHAMVERLRQALDAPSSANSGSAVR